MKLPGTRRFQRRFESVLRTLAAGTLVLISAPAPGESRDRRDAIPPYTIVAVWDNADHWSIAVPVAAEIPEASFLFRDETPRVALIGGALDVVARTLSGAAPAGSMP